MQTQRVCFSDPCLSFARIICNPWQQSWMSRNNRSDPVRAVMNAITSARTRKVSHAGIKQLFSSIRRLPISKDYFTSLGRSTLLTCFNPESVPLSKSLEVHSRDRQDNPSETELAVELESTSAIQQKRPLAQRLNPHGGDSQKHRSGDKPRVISQPCSGKTACCPTSWLLETGYSTQHASV